jgi:hypothetical protein
MVFERLLTHAVLSNIFGSMELFTMISKKFIFFNRLFVVPLLRNAFKFSYKVTYKLVDKGIIELLGPSGIVSGIKAVIQSQYRLQTGFIYHYSGIIFIMLIPFMHMLFEFLCLI